MTEMSLFTPASWGYTFIILSDLLLYKLQRDIFILNIYRKGNNMNFLVTFFI